MYEYWFSQVRRQDREEERRERFGRPVRDRQYSWNRIAVEGVFVEGLLFVVLVAIVGLL